jgi:hypothetical protein
MMTYDLRRLRLHGIVERLPRTHRYRLTRDGLRVALFFTRAYARLLRPALSIDHAPPASPPHRNSAACALSRLATAFDQLVERCAFKVA